MDNKQKEQEFWEWCGFTQNKQNYGRGSEYLWNYPDSQVGTLPSIDLNNLFKYAVPKLKPELRGFKARILLQRWITDVLMGEDPALALYQAIQKARGVK